MESSDPMKPTPKSELPPLLAFGSHPDDVEFGCGGVLVKEARAGRPIHLVVCSRGEAATHGTPTRRALEARHAARLLRASLQFIHLDGDAHLEIRAAHAFKQDPADLPTIYLSEDGVQTGPHTLAQIQARLAQQELDAKTIYWMEGMKEWENVMDLAERPPGD